MTKRLPRFDSHVQAFRDLEAMQAAQEAAAQERAADLAAESGPFPRALTEAEQARLAALEEAAEKAEGDSDFRAAALAWAEGAKLCRVAGQMDSAAQWEGHCRKAAGAAFKAQGKAARKAAPKPAPAFTIGGFPARFAQG